VRGRGPSSAARGNLGQHFVRSDTLAAELVRLLRVSKDDLVLEIGAGSGRLTHALALRARRVIAVEVDERLGRRLRRVFAGVDSVQVVSASVLDVPLPAEPFRAFGNLPFSATTEILRWLLDDPLRPLARADLIVQAEVARKRSRRLPSSLLSLSWMPWWHLSIERHLPPSSFVPQPRVHAAMLRVDPREPPLLDPERRRAYVDLLRLAFARGAPPLRSTLGSSIEPRRLKRGARRAGVDLGARPSHLDVETWCALFSELA
jgi:23S rRNA (adenine-N6)-dimethyltransferase